MVISKDKLVPQIRFKGFNDAWEQRKLGEVAEVTKLAGFEFTKYIIYTDKGEIIALRGLNVKNGTLVLDDVKYIDQSDLSKLNRSKLFKDDILFTYVGTVGELAVVPENDKYYLAPNVARIRLCNNIYPLFVSYMMGNKEFYDKVIYPLIATSSQPALSMENVRKFYIVLPQINEQTAIGNFFRTLDDTILLHKRKHEMLKKLKKGYLQQMFPQKGECVPKVRFKGFTDDWEIKTLGDLGTISMNRRIFKEQTTEIGDVPFYKIGTFGGQPDAYISRKLFLEYKLKYPYPKNGDLLISASGSIGKIVEYTGKDEYFQDSNIVWLQHDEKIENIFLKQFYSIVNWCGLEGSTIKRLYNKNILETKILLPSRTEQTAIGELFHNLDEQITDQQIKLDKLKLLKTAYLQKMFV